MKKSCVLFLVVCISAALFVPGLTFAGGSTTVQYTPPTFVLYVDPFGNITGNRAFSEVQVTHSDPGTFCTKIQDFYVYHLDGNYYMLGAMMHNNDGLCSFNPSSYYYMPTYQLRVGDDNLILKDDKVRALCANKEGTSQTIRPQIQIVYHGSSLLGGLKDVILDSRPIPVSISCLARCPSLNLPSALLPDGLHSKDYKYQFKALGGQPPLTYSLAAGSLPNGLKLSPDGVISGTAEHAGKYNFSIMVTDSCNYKKQTVPQSLSLMIACIPLEITTPSELPIAVFGNNYHQFLMGSGDDGVSISIAGSLPPGIVVENGGRAISGVPRKLGDYSFTMTVTDNCVLRNNSTSKTFSLKVGIQPVKPEVPTGPFRHLP
jgi:hypothetical protein